MMKAVTAYEMQRIESEWFDSGRQTLENLMDQVGSSIAEWVVGALHRPAALCNIAVLAGKGNNGGDAIIAAKYLAGAGAKVDIILCLPRGSDDPLLKSARDSGVRITDASQLQRQGRTQAVEICGRADIVIDGVFGFSISRPIDGGLGALFRAVRDASSRIVAIDLPSGAHPDTGSFDANGLPADCTLSVGLPKIGTALRFGHPEFGREHHVLDIGVPDGLTDGVKSAILTDELCSGFLPPRSALSHKGDHGRALLIVGSGAYPGAAVLAAKACARSSVGLLTVAVDPSVKPIIAAAVPESTYLDLPALPDGHTDAVRAVELLLPAVQRVDAVLIGSGMGVSQGNRALLERLFAARDEWRDTVAICDADALTMMAGSDTWDASDGNVIVTPHPGEMSRFLGTDIASVEADRRSAVERAAHMVGGVAVLKGASTLIADADGRLRINMRPNSGLARGGTGDALAGLTTGLAAQSDPFDAASIGVHLHSVAGEMATSEIGEYGLTASDVIGYIPAALRQLASSRVTS